MLKFEVKCQKRDQTRYKCPKNDYYASLLSELLAYIIIVILLLQEVNSTFFP